MVFLTYIIIPSIHKILIQKGATKKFRTNFWYSSCNWSTTFIWYPFFNKKVYFYCSFVCLRPWYNKCLKVRVTSIPTKKLLNFDSVQNFRKLIKLINQTVNLQNVSLTTSPKYRLSRWKFLVQSIRKPKSFYIHCRQKITVISWKLSGATYKKPRNQIRNNWVIS